MHSVTTVQSDATLLVAVVLSVLLTVWLARLLSTGLAQRQESKPVLPLSDRAPAGLTRLVPVGAQVEDEARRGIVALEQWLMAYRRSA